MKVTEKQSAEHMDGTAKTQSTKKKGHPQSSSTQNVSTGGEIGSAKVKLSERAQDMKKIKDAVNSQPDVDEAKVAKFKSMLAKGEYKVNSKAVADKMVDEHAYNDFLSSEE